MARPKRAAGLHRLAARFDAWDRVARRARGHALAAALAVAACAPQSDAEAAGTDGMRGARGPGGSTAAAGPTASSDRADTLSVELQVPEEVPAGQPLEFTIRVRNTADRPLELHLLGREIAFDLVVRDSRGGLVWERLEGETVMAILRLETLAPGQALELTGSWDQRTMDGSPAAPGTYSLQGLVPNDGPEPLATPTTSLRIASPP